MRIKLGLMVALAAVAAAAAMFRAEWDPYPAPASGFWLYSWQVGAAGVTNRDWIAGGGATSAPVELPADRVSAVAVSVVVEGLESPLSVPALWVPGGFLAPSLPGTNAVLLWSVWDESTNGGADWIERRAVAPVVATNAAALYRLKRLEIGGPYLMR